MQTKYRLITLIIYLLSNYIIASINIEINTPTASRPNILICYTNNKYSTLVNSLSKNINNSKVLSSTSEICQAKELNNLQDLIEKKNIDYILHLNANIDKANNIKLTCKITPSKYYNTQISATNSSLPSLNSNFQITASLNDLEQYGYYIADFAISSITGIHSSISNKLVYVFKSTENIYSIETIRIDGKNKDVLYKSKYPLYKPIWSKNNRYIIFIKNRYNSSEIMQLDLITKKITSLIKTNSNIASIDFYNNDNSIIFNKNFKNFSNIYDFNLKTKITKPITYGRHNYIDIKSTNDKSILVVSKEHNDQYQLFYLDIDNNKYNLITTEKGINLAPSISTNNNYITYKKNHMNQFYPQIGLIDLANKEETVLECSLCIEIEPSISPGGYYIACNNIKNQHSKITVLDRAGSTCWNHNWQKGKIYDISWSNHNIVY